MLPFGWTEQYAINHLIEENQRLKDVVASLTLRLADLEAEITRLDMSKANKPGRKVKV